MEEHYLRNFELYFPGFFARMKIYQVILGELIAELEDGTIVSYNDLNNSLRIVKRDDEIWDEIKMRNELSWRIYNRMQFLGMTQDELSERTGISQTAISKYINRRAIPSAFNLRAIAKALKCSMDDLTYMED